MKDKIGFLGQVMVSLILIFLSNGAVCYGAADVDATPWHVAQKSFTPIPRAADVVLLPGGRQLVATMELGSNLLFRCDASNGQLLGTYYTREGNPQCLVRVPSGIVLVQDKARTPEASTLSPAELRQENTLVLPDFRLYRVASASTSQGGRYIWLGSCYTMSSLYGHINSALFRVDLHEGKSALVRGPVKEPATDRHIPNLALPFPSENNWLVSSAASGEILAADIHTNRLIIFVGNSLEPAKSMQIPFVPTVMPREFGRILPVARPDRLALVDLDKATVTSIEYKGHPLSSCVSSDGQTAFLSVAGSNEVLQISLRDGRILPNVDFCRSDGRRDLRGSEVGYDTYDIAVLRWADNPSRLIGLGYDGYILMIAQLAKTTEQTNTEPTAASPVVDR